MIKKEFKKIESLFTSLNDKDVILKRKVKSIKVKYDKDRIIGYTIKYN